VKTSEKKMLIEKVQKARVKAAMMMVARANRNMLRKSLWLVLTSVLSTLKSRLEDSSSRTLGKTFKA
jgi:hypothetical protein